MSRSKDGGPELRLPNLIASSQEKESSFQPKARDAAVDRTAGRLLSSSQNKTSATGNSSHGREALEAARKAALEKAKRPSSAISQSQTTNAAAFTRPSTAPASSTKSATAARRESKSSETAVAAAVKELEKPKNVQFTPAAMQDGGFDYVDENYGYKPSFTSSDPKKPAKNPFEANITGLEDLLNTKENLDLLASDGSSGRATDLRTIYFSRDLTTRTFVSQVFKKRKIDFFNSLHGDKHKEAQTRPNKANYKDNDSSYLIDVTFYLLQNIIQKTTSENLPRSIQNLQLDNSLGLIVEQITQICTLGGYGYVDSKTIKDKAAAVTKVCNERIQKSTSLEYSRRVWEAQNEVVRTSGGKMNFALTRPSPKPFLSRSLSGGNKTEIENTIFATWQVASLESFEKRLEALSSNIRDRKVGGVPTVIFDGGTGEGKTFLIQQIEKYYGDKIEITTIDLNSSAAKISSLSSKKSTAGRIQVCVFDELYFYGKDFLDSVNIKNASDIKAIEQAKAKFIKDLAKKNILTVVAGATENPTIYKIAQERIREKLSSDYELAILSEDSLSSASEDLKGGAAKKMHDVLLENIKSRELKLSQKINTAQRMEKKREDAKEKIDSASFAKIDDVSGYRDISGIAEKTEAGKSTLYILPDISAKEFKSADYEKVCGSESFVVVTPCFQNSGEIGQELGYKIWYKDDKVIKSKTVLAKDVATECITIEKQLKIQKSRILIYDNTTAVGGDLGGLALGINQAIIQCASKDKSFDDMVQNIGRDRDDDKSKLEIAIYSDLEKEDFIKALIDNTKLQDIYREEAYLANKDSIKKEHAEESKQVAAKRHRDSVGNQSRESTQKLEESKRRFQLGTEGRRLEEEQAEEARKAKEAEEAAQKALQEQAEEERRKLKEEARLKKEAEEKAREEVERRTREEAERKEKEEAERKKAKLLSEKKDDLLNGAVQEIEKLTKNASDNLSKLSETDSDLEELKSFFTNLAATSVADTGTIAIRVELEGLQEKVKVLTKGGKQKDLEQFLESIKKEIGAAQETTSLSKQDANIQAKVDEAKKLKESSANLSTKISSTIETASTLKGLKENELRELAETAKEKEAAEAREKEELRQKAELETAQQKLLTEQREEVAKLLENVTSLKRNLEKELLVLTALPELNEATHKLSAKKQDLANLQKENSSEESKADSAEDSRLKELREKIAATEKEIKKAIGTDLTTQNINKADTEGLKAIRSGVNGSSALLSTMQSKIEAFKNDKVKLLQDLTSESKTLDDEIKHQKELTAIKIGVERNTENQKQSLEEEKQKRAELELEREREMEAKRANILQEINLAIEMLKVDSVDNTLASLDQSLQQVTLFKNELTVNIAELTTLSVKATSAQVKDPTKEAINSRNTLLQDLTRVEKQSELRESKATLLEQLEKKKEEISKGNYLFIDSYDKESKHKTKAADLIGKIAEAKTNAELLVKDNDLKLAEFISENKNFELAINSLMAQSALEKEVQELRSKQEQRRLKELSDLGVKKSEGALLLSSTEQSVKAALSELETLDKKLKNTELKELLSKERGRLAKLIKEIQNLGNEKEGESAEAEVLNKYDDTTPEKLAEQSANLRSSLEEIKARLENYNLESNDLNTIKTTIGLISREADEIREVNSNIEALGEHLESFNQELNSLIEKTTSNIKSARETIEKASQQAYSQNSDLVMLDEERVRRAAEEALKKSNARLLSEALKSANSQRDRLDEISQTLLEEETSGDLYAENRLGEERNLLLQNAETLTKRVKAVYDSAKNLELNSAGSTAEEASALINELSANLSETNGEVNSLGQKAQKLRSDQEKKKREEEEAKKREKEEAKRREEEEAKRKEREEAAAKKEDEEFNSKKALLAKTYEITTSQLNELNSDLTTIRNLREDLERQLEKEKDEDSELVDSDDRENAVQKIKKLELQKSGIDESLKAISDYLSNLDSKKPIDIKGAINQIDIYQKSLMEIQKSIQALKKNIIISINEAKSANSAEDGTVVEQLANVQDESPAPASATTPTQTHAQTKTADASSHKDSITTINAQEPVPLERPSTATLRKINQDIDTAIKQSALIESSRLEEKENSLREAARLEFEALKAEGKGAINTYEVAEQKLLESYKKDPHTKNWVVEKDGRLQMNEERKLLGRENATFKSFSKACIKIASYLEAMKQDSALDLIGEVWNKSDLQQDKSGRPITGNQFALSGPQKIALVRVSLLLNSEFWESKNITSDEAKDAFLHKTVNMDTVGKALEGDLKSAVEASLDTLKELGAKSIKRLIELRTNDATEQNKDLTSSRPQSPIRPSSAMQIRGSIAKLGEINNINSAIKVGGGR